MGPTQTDGAHDETVIRNAPAGPVRGSALPEPPGGSRYAEVDAEAETLLLAAGVLELVVERESLR